MRMSSFSEIGDAIRASERIVILSHARPDGDAIGSQVALGESLRAAGKTVQLLNEDGTPLALEFLPCSDSVAMPLGNVEADLVIALDTANKVRLGARCLDAIAGISPLINIDHHKSNELYGDVNYVDAESPASGQIVYELLVDQGLPITREVVSNLFVAISTDTGSFRYPSTTARTYEIVAKLVDAGADVGELSRLTYENYPARRIELLKELLSVYRLTSGGRVASWILTDEIKTRIGVQASDSENLIDLIRGIDSVIVAVFFEQLPGGRVRVSMRSKSNAADVCAICGEFGGGGHTLAAGARVKGDIAEVEKRVLDKIHETIER
ncbi:MAG: phosphoesterase RecJ-like protein [Pseudoalteromonas tetraodonis]